MNSSSHHLYKHIEWMTLFPFPLFWHSNFHFPCMITVTKNSQNNCISTGNIGADMPGSILTTEQKEIPLQDWRRRNSSWVEILALYVRINRNNRSPLRARNFDTTSSRRSFKLKIVHFAEIIAGKSFNIVLLQLVGTSIKP